MKVFLKILFILIFIAAGAFVFTHPAKTETNILKAVFSDNSADDIIVKLSGRYSSKINVLVEAETPETASETASEFYNAIDKTIFETENFDTAKLLEKYSRYSKNLLSKETARKLEQNSFSTVEGEAFARLYDPVGFMLLPLNEDPFMLFTDYIKSLGSENPDEFEMNGKYYKFLSLKIKNDTALSPELLNDKIKNLVRLQDKLSTEECKIYLTGTPVHSYYASSNSMTEINIICLLSSIFIIWLCYYYFRNIKLLIPIAVSLGFGMLSGYFAASIIFHKIHVLTFVFSTTLLGICIDYSLHYFIEKDLSKIIKSLTVSMLTTVSAFAVLLFSGVELLKQISVFTMTGLLCVYLIVVLFYPLLKFEYSPRIINFYPDDTSKKFIALTVVIVAAFGMISLKFNDDIKNMYVPSKKLLAAEKLFASVTGGNKQTAFAVVEGKNIQDILIKEERIAKNLDVNNYQALSKFIPSEKQQKKNFELRQKLYKHSLSNYATFLTKDEINKLLTEKPSENYLEFDKNSPFADFLVSENTSVMVLYDFNRPEIIEQNGGKYVNVQKDISERIKNCRVSCVKILPAVFVLVFLLLSFIYKPLTAAKILAPSIISSAFAIGLVNIIGEPISLFHILAVFLIIGFGLDYSVFRAGGVKNSSDADYFLRT